jgi:DNA (cytosine-5)-methyltransferase 1
MLFNYKWKLADGYPVKGIEKSNLKVFTTFSCGGGSSMGYKLAGYDVIGANDIDPEMQKVYLENHKPKHYILAPIIDLLDMDLPPELYDLDVLDGSPPCSTFSMAGHREKVWKKDKQFREGQAKQVLSDLFFDFISLTDKLKPKVFIAENVKGMVQGNAKAYTREILKAFDQAGYDTQLFLLNSGSMGLPQNRERVFFVGRRKDLNMSPIKISFNEKPVTFNDLEKQCSNPLGKELSDTFKQWWSLTHPGKSFSYGHPKGSFFNSVKVHPNKVLGTIAASTFGKISHHSKPFSVSDELLQLASSFPLDYNFLENPPQYIMGMSVPPLMMAQVAYQVRKQLFKI